jgi:5-methyltetrahydropteroyltriglutamate--homocysteine methyltransferase
VKYIGEAAVQKDIANLKAAARAAGVPDEQVFMPATAASGVGRNEYYKTKEEYFHAIAAALRHEYEAIVAAGFLLQVDDPFLPDIFYEPGLSEEQMKRRAGSRRIQNPRDRRTRHEDPNGSQSPRLLGIQVRRGFEIVV